MKPMDFPPILQDLVKAFSEYQEVELIILFGSRVFGDEDERSDIDLAISAPKMSSRRWLELIRLAEEAKTLLWVTVVRLEHSPDYLREQIIKHGMKLYERKKIEE